MQILKTARGFIEDQMAADGTGREKADRVLDQVMEYLDGIIEPKKPFAEWLSDRFLDLVLRPVFKAIIAELFDEMMTAALKGLPPEAGA